MRADGASGAAMAFLELRRITKRFVAPGGAVREVLGGIDLDVEEGEFVTVVGYSGSGKTTLLSLVAGLLKPDAGEIRLDGRPVTGPGPDRGVVFQTYSLLPWLTVFENVALAVDAASPELPAAARRARTAELLEMVNLGAAAWKRPRELSGGMRQRVAVARSLATAPKLLLLDEPFSALDALTRARLQDELAALCAARRMTALMITNDIDEAILLADRIHPMTRGPRAVLGPAVPVELARPRSRRRVSLEPGYQRARAALVAFLEAQRGQPGAVAVRGPEPAVAAAAAPAGVRGD